MASLVYLFKIPTIYKDKSLNRADFMAAQWSLQCIYHLTYATFSSHTKKERHSSQDDCKWLVGDNSRRDLDVLP